MHSMNTNETKVMVTILSEDAERLKNTSIKYRIIDKFVCMHQEYAKVEMIIPKDELEKGKIKC